MTAKKIPFLSLSLAECGEVFRAMGASPRHAQWVRRNLLHGRPPVANPRTGFTLPLGFLESFEQEYTWCSSLSVEQIQGGDGSEKHLLQLADGQRIEAVRMPGKAAPSACLSSQVGCAMACRFCASGLNGVVRNLEAHEILEQVVVLRRRGAVQRLVFMGAGEAVQNLQALKTVLPVLRDEGSLGPRYVLVSTVGPPQAIDRLASLDLKVTLALSLHSLDQELRGELIPTQAHVEPLELLNAADRYRQHSGRSYQVEYVLLGGVNDSRADARDLARAMKGRRGHLSLIAWNPIPEMAFEQPSQAAVRAFMEVLHQEGISCTLRQTVGEQATAACGQLRAGTYPNHTTSNSGMIVP
ncbi:MAG: 23S rRNA (adenine(2503)-C(2))-methyltransferase RlmN [Planctomycetota bacterium]|nr:MAG: 23S rRNA (adenine(2503)-C(2))-methyltransferase RlmN [Planctomycetota bacterium]